MKRILVAGGTGFVGRHLCQYLVAEGYTLSVLTRRPMPASLGVTYFEWDLEKQWIDPAAFSEVDTIINLTGANIGAERWTKKRKAEILQSRLAPLALLFKYVSDNKHAINLLISSSAVGYYAAVTEETVFKEEDPAGTDFLGTVCAQWEQAAKKFELLNTRVVLFRKGVVIAKDGGVYQKMAPLAKWGINPAVGTGKQYLPWIAMEDMVRLYNFALRNVSSKGSYNAVASQHLTMNDFSNLLLKAYGKRSILPNVPSCLVKIALGEMSQLVLAGSRVSNNRLKDAGFVFMQDSLVL